MSRCISCGYRELACPFDAITLGNEFEISEYSRDDLIYTKDMLLPEPIKKMPVADPDGLDTPIPYHVTASCFSTPSRSPWSGSSGSSPRLPASALGSR